MTVDERVKSLFLKKSKKELVGLLMGAREHERSKASEKELKASSTPSLGNSPNASPAH